MDGARFDELLRHWTTRRRVLHSLSSGTAALLGLSLLDGASAKPKGKKPKGKKPKPKKPKGCLRGQKKCRTKCIPRSHCCDSTECNLDRREYCQLTGRCECNKGAVVHNGRCGFPVACKSVGETCGSNAECCSRACNIPDGVALRCNQGMLLCNVEFDCLSVPCRGFACDGDPILL